MSFQTLLLLLVASTLGTTTLTFYLCYFRYHKYREALKSWNIERLVHPILRILESFLCLATIITFLEASSYWQAVLALTFSVHNFNETVYIIMIMTREYRSIPIWSLVAAYRLLSPGITLLMALLDVELWQWIPTTVFLVLDCIFVEYAFYGERNADAQRTALEKLPATFTSSLLTIQARILAGAAILATPVVVVITIKGVGFDLYGYINPLLYNFANVVNGSISLRLNLCQSDTKDTNTTSNQRAALPGLGEESQNATSSYIVSTMRVSDVEGICKVPKDLV